MPIQAVSMWLHRGDIRGERADMNINTAEATRKEMGKEAGGDYILMGSINSIIDASGCEQIRFYQVDLALVSPADNRIVWTGQKKLVKDIKNARFR